MAGTLTEQDWQVRLYVYRHFVEYGRPPTTFATSDMFGLSEPEMREIYQRLHDGHAFFLEPGTVNVRMANPLSAVETPYRVTVLGRRPLYANCAWDSLGIPAMLHEGAEIESVYTTADGDVPAHYAIRNGELTGDNGLVHFPVPFRHWYDNLIHT